MARITQVAKRFPPLWIFLVALLAMIGVTVVTLFATGTIGFPGENQQVSAQSAAPAAQAVPPASAPVAQQTSGERIDLRSPTAQQTYKYDIGFTGKAVSAATATVISPNYATPQVEAAGKNCYAMFTKRSAGFGFDLEPLSLTKNGDINTIAFAVSSQGFGNGKFTGGKATVSYKSAKGRGSITNVTCS